MLSIGQYADQLSHTETRRIEPLSVVDGRRGGTRDAHRSHLASQWWNVTMPMAAVDGRPGTHTFVVQAHTANAALKSARWKATAADARRHRRHAVVNLGAAAASLWVK